MHPQSIIEGYFHNKLINNPLSSTLKQDIIILVSQTRWVDEKESIQPIHTTIKNHSQTEHIQSPKELTDRGYPLTDRDADQTLKIKEKEDGRR